MEYEFDMVDNLDKINQVINIFSNNDYWKSVYFQNDQIVKFEARHLVLNQINFILDEMKMKNLAPRCLEVRTVAC